MPPRPRLALRLIAIHGFLALLIMLFIGGILLAQHRWQRDRQALLDESLPRLSDMLAVSRLGDVLAETAGTLATARDPAQRARARASIAEARDALTARLDGLNGTRLEIATRDRLRAALADMSSALDNLDGLMGRRFDLGDATALATARLAILGDLLPDLERALLAGRTPETLPDFLDLPDTINPAPPTGTRQAEAVRGWARNAQVAVGMLLAATGAATPSDLEYLSLRADESLRRAAAAIRRANTRVIPLLEALQAELAALAAGVEGRDGVVRLRQQRLGVEQNAPAVLARARQASDRLTAAVTQVIADLEQTQAVRRAALDREALVWRIGAGALGVFGLAAAALGAGLVWRALVVRLRALVRATRAAVDSAPLVLPRGADRADELGALTRAVAALDADRRRMDRARHDGDAQVRVLMAATPTGLVLLGDDDRIEGVNAAAQRIFGHAEAVLLGRPIADLVDDRTAAWLRDGLKALTVTTLASPSPPTWVGDGRHADGHTLPLSLSLVGERASDRLTAVLVITVRGLAPAWPMADTESNQAGFLAALAHDLGGPIGTGLTGVTFLAERADRIAADLDDGDVKKADCHGFLTQVRETVGLLENTLRQAADLVDSVRTVAVDEASHRRRSVQVDTYLGDVVASLKPRLRGTGHRLALDCPPGLTLDSHPGALFRVVANLTLNALAHAFPDGRAGTITLSVRPLSGKEGDPATEGLRDGAGPDPSPARIEIRVGDDGVGMTEAVRARLFDPFFTTGAEAGGSGLGLPLVRDLVTGPLGGTVTVESAEGQGTTVIVRLPRVAPGQDAMVAETAAGARGDTADAS